MRKFPANAREPSRGVLHHGTRIKADARKCSVNFAARRTPIPPALLLRCSVPSVNAFLQRNYRVSFCIRATSIPIVPIHPLNILIADDEPSVAASLSHVLRARGHSLETVTDGLQAFKMLTEHPEKFDVLIADNTMPGLTGSELVRKLRTVNFPGKIMILSGYLTPELERAYRALGVDEIIHKPYDISAVRMAIERVGEAVTGDDAE